MLFLPLDIPPIPNKEKILENFYGKTHAVGYDKNNELILFKNFIEFKTEKAKMNIIGSKYSCIKGHNNKEII